MRISTRRSGILALLAVALLMGDAPHVAAADDGGVFGLFFGSKSNPEAKPKEAKETPDVPSDDPRAIATHVQTAIINVSKDGTKSNDRKLHTFCLDANGNILAGVGEEPGEVRAFDPDGKFLAAWEVPIKPEAIGFGDDGSIFVGGSGRIVKLDGEGSIVKTSDAPHIAALKENEDKLREQVVQQLRQRADMFTRQIERYEQRVAKLEEKPEEDRSEREVKRLKTYQRQIEMLKKMEKENSPGEIDDEKIEAALQASINRKQRVSSISAADGDVYIACYGAVGYGFDVWRMDDQLDSAEQIVKGLRGCCGQMDVQAGPNGIYVAENSRDRVCRYDRDGKMITHWGKSARKGLVGFGSCCNPMNVAFGPEDTVYTAESGSGRIKRYSADGELLGLVGKVKLVPGCKNVAIAVSQDGERVYMLDITRTHIVMMTKRAETAEPDEDEPAAKTAAVERGR